MRLDDLVVRADQLLAMAQKTLSTSRRAKSGHDVVERTEFYAFRSASLSFLTNTFGTHHPYFKEFDRRVGGALTHSISDGLGILQAVREEIAGGWLQKTKGLVSAEIFSDFLEMAAYLLSEHYKDPAAVIVGSVLEEHLRQLCQKENIPVEAVKNGKSIPKKADLLNVELAKAGVYTTLDQKNVTAWLDLRNKAAHGRYAEYTEEQVQLLLQAVQEFIARVHL